MNDTRRIIRETAHRMFADHCTPETLEAAESGALPSELWNALTESGLLLAGIEEAAGGAGGDLGDSLDVLHTAGRFAVPGPIAETLIASWMLSEAGLEIPDGPLTIAIEADTLPAVRIVEGGWLLSGAAAGVPWPNEAARLVVIAKSDDGTGNRVCAVEAPAGVHSTGSNLAGEPRDDVLLEDVIVAPGDTVKAPPTLELEAIREFGALCRAQQIAGALERVLELAIDHANVREQFGRPIGAFQAVRQQIAVLATQVAAANRAAQRAVETVGSGEAAMQIAIAKSRTGEAAGIAAAIAHQIHGAMGITHEHTLHHFTRRLWTWRDDFGPEKYWNGRLGRAAAAAGSDGLWPLITTL